MLVDLADALDVSVDALLRDDLGYRDIKKKDLEEYLPFIIAVCGFIGYHIMVKLGISLIHAVLCTSDFDFSNRQDDGCFTYTIIRNNDEYRQYVRFRI